MPGCGDDTSSGGNGGGSAGGPDGGNGTGGDPTTGGNPPVGGEGEGGEGGNPNECGNGSLDIGEDCDGAELDDESCGTLGFDSGTLACSATCSFDTSGCTAAECGDATVNGTEECDGTALDGETCITQGFDSGTLACSGTCNFDTSGCVNRSCGDMTINGTEDCDGTALGAGTCVTEGFDGGPALTCAANCSYVTTACANENCVDNVDNDGDATIDCLDTSCAPECADACNSVPTISDPGTVTGSTTGHADVLTNTCGAALGGNSGPETVHQVTAAVTGFMHVTLTSDTADHGISARMGCPGTEIMNACDDSDFGAGAVERISIPVTAGQVVHLLVDGYDNAAAGTYTLDVETVATSTCGDDFTDATELCDPTGEGADDGTCNATCTNFCGNGVCSAADGETSCNCAADCPDDPNTCSTCGDCGDSGGTGDLCWCDSACVANGDCCANVVTSCGVNVALTGAALAAPVGNYTGTLASMRCVNINNTQTGAIFSVNSVVAALATTWIGDMVIKVRSPALTTITLVSRPGLVELADNGSTAQGFGSDDNVVSTSPITFAPGAAVSAENMGVTVGDVTVCQSNGICTYLPNAGAAAAGTLANFVAQNPVGNWQFCIGDALLGDTVDVSTTSETINLTIIP